MQDGLVSVVWRRAVKSLFITLCFCALIAPLPALAQSQALGLSWKGYADTNLRFSEFFAGNHTLAVRFMPQFPNAYQGPIVAESGTGQFFLGQGDFLNGGATNLVLTVGSASRSFSTALVAGRWTHLAVVATTSGSQRVFTLYLNGSSLGTLAVSSTDAQLPSGTLRFGKRTSGQTVGGRDAQFYGFVDDVAVFTRALSAAEIGDLSTRLDLTANPPANLLAGYVFSGGSLPAAFNRPVSLSGAAQRIVVSTNRSNATDAASLPLPTQQQEMTLPFPVGEAWQVIQGYDDPGGSHQGYASFCWDLILAGKPQPGLYPNGSGGAPFYAAAQGQVVTVKESGTSGTSVPNLIEIQQAPGEIAGYLHLQQNSAIPVVGNSVIRRQKVALTGDVGANVGANHLHLATTDKADGVFGFITFPVAISNYELQTPTGWRRVFRGIPKNGEVVRVPADPSALYNVVFTPGSVKELHVEGYTYADYRAAYDSIFPQGWRLHQLHAYVQNNQVLYNAVWRPGTSGEIQVYGWTYADYRAYYDQIFPQGWRLKILQSYVVNNQVLYNAVWTPSTSGEIQVYGWTYADYRAYYDQIFPQGWRLKILQSYVVNGQVLYNAVWTPSTAGEIQLYGYRYADYRAYYDSIFAQGWRLKILQSYVVNGQVLYNAVFTPSTAGEIQIYGWLYKDFIQKYDELRAQGWRIGILDAYRP